MTMVELEGLLRVRSAYERAFKLLGLDVDSSEERFSDRDLQLSGHVFVASAEQRRFQISLSEDTVPCAFLKATGVDYEIALLQILVSPNDLMVEQSAALFAAWIQDRASAEATSELASRFGR